MSRRYFFQFFCMFYLRLINRKCAKEKTSISNVIPELKKKPSLLRIICQCLICMIAFLLQSWSNSVSRVKSVCDESNVSNVSSVNNLNSVDNKNTKIVQQSKKFRSRCHLYLWWCFFHCWKHGEVSILTLNLTE